MQEDDLKNRFTYHKPTPESAGQFVEIRKMALDFANYLNGACPEGREKSLAITHLEDTVMWANASIARTGEAQ